MASKDRPPKERLTVTMKKGQRVKILSEGWEDYTGTVGMDTNKNGDLFVLLDNTTGESGGPIKFFCWEEELELIEED